MNAHLLSLPCRSAGQWEFRTKRTCSNPFTDVRLDVIFRGPDGNQWVVPAFYDGGGAWRARFNPGLPGSWTFRAVSRPEDRSLESQGEFEVVGSPGRGFLKSTPGKAWGFHYESGEPAFLLGDTVYNLFGAAHCGLEVDSFLERRASQGFNLLRVRLPVSPFHPPAGYSDWQTRRTWPWGGSEQAPRFDQFNLDYFHTVDRVMRKAEALGLGFELIMEAWGFEFPFNSRSLFTTEWEELWLRYLIARYDAFNAACFWTPLNEYEYYPNGDWHYKPIADRWAMRVARWMRENAPHGHILSIHNGPVDPPFARRFAADPGAIDTVMFQCWGSKEAANGWLAAGIEEQIQASFEGWPGTAILAEYGYERNPELELKVPSHEFCDEEHTRRGAWRGAFCAMHVIHGFENTWGPWQILDRDQPGLSSLLNLRRFFEVVPFHRLRPDAEIVEKRDAAPGCAPLALATPERDLVAVYLPVGGRVKVRLHSDLCRWYDPRRGEFLPADGEPREGGRAFQAPIGRDARDHPWDWVLLIGGPP